MFCFLFAVVLFRSHCVRGQHQGLIQGDHGLKRSIFQQGLSYANFVAHKFQFLQGSMLDSSCEVNRATECGFACVANAPCVSFNVALSPNENGKLRCELLTEDKFTSPDKLTDSQQFHHYSIKTPCSRNLCRNDGTCIPNYEEDQYHCVCAPGFTGFHCTRECLAPLGMENFTITSAQISASSRFSSDNHSPNYGRLNFKENAGAWAVGVKDLNQWIQIDFRVQTTVTYVATQGRHNYHTGQWVTQYKLQYSNDGNSFQVFKQQGENSDKVFVGNNDSDTVVKHHLTPPIKTRHIRLAPTAWKGHISMRMELYGCPDE